MLLAIIGPDWLTAERDGKRRLDDPDDWVRREIGIALGMSRVQVIPVMVGDAELPTPEQLPEPLARLPGRQATTVRPDRFEDDVENLIERIGGWRRRWHGFALWTWVAAAAAVMGLIAIAFVIRSNRPPVVTPQQVTATGMTPREIDVLPWVEDEGMDDLTFHFDTLSTQGGTVTDEGGGSVTYSGPQRFQGRDSFGFTVVDEQGEETNATVVVSLKLGPLGADYSVAVAELTTTGGDQATAKGLSESLYQQVSTELESQTDANIFVASPDMVGPLAGDTPEARAEAAAELASRSDADLVVFGNLEVEGGVARLAAEFYLSDRGLTGAEELAGAYALDSLRLSTADPLAMSLAASQLLEPKISALTKLALGLSHYQLHQYAEAEDLFEDAVIAWPGTTGNANGQEVVFHLLGNVSGLLHDIDTADRYYNQALDLSPGYVRSHFGVAEVQYQRAKGELCDGEGPADAAGLEGAVALFEEVTTMPAPPLSFMAERARVEIARVYLCLTLNGVNRSEQAREVLEALITEIASEPRLSDVLAEAHFSLGTYYLLTGETEAAVDEITTAIDTTFDRGRQRGFYWALAAVYECYLGEVGLAEAYRRQAESIIGEPLKPISCTGA